MSYNPFESIESAHEFLRLLAETVVEAKRDLQADIPAEPNSNISRRVEALQRASYNLEKLQHHVKTSVHIE